MALRPQLANAARLSGALLCACVLLLAGCSRWYQSWYVSGTDRDISRATKNLEAARDDAQRAAAHADRGDAYGEKSRYSRAMQLISNEEYTRLFDLAVQEHNRAIALAPENAELYYRRGRGFYDRAALDMMYDSKATAWLVPARADFSKAVERNRNNAMFLDFLGLADASAGNWTEAIADFEQEAALDPKASYRVSDAYCNRGTGYLREEKYDLAAPDLEKAIQVRGLNDACECEPYNPLLAVYIDHTREYDKARAVVARARSSGRWIAPEYLERLNSAAPAR